MKIGQTDEVTRAKLGVVLMDVIGVNVDEFSMEDLDKLAACCRTQFVDIGPLTRIRVDQVAGVDLEPIMVDNRPDPPTLHQTEIIVNVAIIGAGKYSSRVPMEDGLNILNILTGRVVTEETIQAIGLRRS